MNVFAGNTAATSRFIGITGKATAPRMVEMGRYGQISSHIEGGIEKRGKMLYNFSPPFLKG
jgi:hypothetical protein